MRDYILIYINGERYEIGAEQSKMTLARFLRFELSLKGTKIVCSEGDCGACTVLVKKTAGPDENFRTINSCIMPLYLLDCSQIITIEGVETSQGPHEVQRSMVDNHGSQCGYCTPGFICSMAAMCDDVKREKKVLDSRKAKNYMTGNLCRCTGYEPIIDSALKVDLSLITPMNERYPDPIDLSQLVKESVMLETETSKVHVPSSEAELLSLIGNDSRINSGGSDLGVLVNKGKYTGENYISLNNIEEFYKIKQRTDEIEIGAKVNLEHLTKALNKDFPEFSKLLHIFASPQIKNTATLIGNVANGSPIGDTIPFLYAAYAKIKMISKTGVRAVEVRDFYKGYKDFDLKEGEVISSVILPKKNLFFKIYKASQRKDLDITAVGMAISYKLEGTKISEFTIALGGVGPTVLRIVEIENMMIGAELKEELFIKAANKLVTLIHPLSDLRGSKEYRLLLCKNLLLKFFYEVDPLTNECLL